MAEANATNVWNHNTAAVFNTGAPDTDYIYTDEASALKERWREKAGMYGCTRAASDSSGEAKVDLKLQTRAGWSCFNYHIKFRARPPRDTGVTMTQIEASRRENITRQLNSIRNAEREKLGLPHGEEIKINWHNIPL